MWRCRGKGESHSVDTPSSVTRDGVRCWVSAPLPSLSQYQPDSHVLHRSAWVPNEPCFRLKLLHQSFPCVFPSDTGLLNTLCNQLPARLRLQGAWAPLDCICPLFQAPPKSQFQRPQTRTMTLSHSNSPTALVSHSLCQLLLHCCDHTPDRSSLGKQSLFDLWLPSNLKPP